MVVSPGHAVFQDIKTQLLFFRRDAKYSGKLEGEEENRHGDHDPADNADNANNLVSKLVNGNDGVVIEAICTGNIRLGCKDSHREYPPDSTRAMDRKSIQRVIDLTFL
mmetsp:Transcript_32590/g.52499  ORF Transcript_32590/g.52499 Transcript_32590/m.52499 type:complete len:108 (-) Transcript_32590:1176-1499(-)